MGVLAWLLIGVGLYLQWAASTNRNPASTAVALAKGNEIPDKGTWHKVPDAPVDDDNIVGQWLPIPGRGGSSAAESAAGGVISGVFGGGKRGAVVAFAEQQIGERYVFGAAGPTTWDCSGLTMKAYKQAGVNLPHNAAMQQALGKKVSSPQVGDLVFWGSVSSHVGIFIGNDSIIHAPQPGDVVKISQIWDKAHVNYRSYL